MSGNSSWSRRQTAPIVRGRSRGPSGSTGETTVATGSGLQKRQAVLADLDLVTVFELRALDPATVDVGAVETLLVVDVVAVVTMHEHRVPTGDGDVVEEDLVLGPAADAEALGLDRVSLARAAATGTDDQRGALDPQVGERERFVIGHLLGRERHRCVRTLFVVREQRAALGAVIRGFRILEAALGAV